MSNIETSEVVVLAARCRKSATGKPLVFMQVQTRPDAPIGYVRCTTATPPLPGTRVIVKGPVVTTPQGPVMQLNNEKDIVLVSGQQGILLRDTVAQMLERMGVEFDVVRLNEQLLDPEVHLANMSKDLLIDLLFRAGIANARALVEARESVFSSTLTRAFFDGCENIRSPFEVDTKRDLAFKKDTWPEDVLQGCLPNYIEAIHGQTAHKAMPDGKRLYLSDVLRFDGIDNFFRALAIQSGQTGIYPAWIKDSKRPAMITTCFIRDKQKEGVQIFTPDILKQLERMGITNAEQIAARLGNMFQVTIPGEPVAIIPQGTYQSASRVATLDKMSSTFTPLSAKPRHQGLDPHQKHALDTFCAGAPVMLVAGPPGTGKSTIISRFIQHLQDSPGEEVVVLTPTGKAASRLNQEFEMEFPADKMPIATTIHAMFFPGRSANHPGFSTYALKPALDSSAVHSFPLRVDRVMQASTYKDGNKTIIKTADALHADMVLPASLAGKTVIIDEASQVPNDLLALILSLRPKRLVLAGDPSQHEPMGAGKPFHDYIQIARQGLLRDKLVLIELQTDHRATKELAAFTAELRKGAIPDDNVSTFDSASDSAVDIANVALSQGGTVIETADMHGVKAVIEQLFTQLLAREQPFYSFFQNDGLTAQVGKDTAGFIVPVRMATELSCHVTAMPDTMVMANTNAEVRTLNHLIQSYVRPHMQRGSAIQNLALFAGLVSHDLLPGDLLMQTDNARTRVQYATPQGTKHSSRTMNGEAYLFLGANVWLPLPMASSTSDVEFMVNNAWAGTGLAADIKEAVAMGAGSDPDFHCALYQQLSSLADQGNKHALKLMQMSLGEVMIIDQLRLRNLGGKLGEMKTIPAEYIKHLPILPSIPRSAPGAVNNDDAVLGLARRVWKVQEMSAHGSNLHHGGKDVDYPAYQRLYDATSKALGSFASGNAYTVHKAQGSQARTAVSVVSPPYSDEDGASHERGAYTAITRAQERGVMLVHGKTVGQLNKIWADTRIAQAAHQSASLSIARGHLPPLCETLAMTTTYVPVNTKLVVAAGHPDKSTMRAFRRRSAIASMGLPSDVVFPNPTPRMKSLISNSEPNSGHGLVSADIPDSGRIAALVINADSIKNKRGMAWTVERSHKAVMHQQQAIADDALSAALVGIAGVDDMQFDMF